MTPRAAILALIASRSPDKTVCPSEVARSLAREAGSPNGWRTLVPAVHEAVDELVAEGSVELSWKSKPLGKRAGPYRIRQRHN